MSKLTENLTRELKESPVGQVVYGSRVALKQLKKDNIEKIYVTLDCPMETKQKLEKSKAGASIIKLDMTKEMLKELCRRPFNVSVLSILKAEVKGKGKENAREKIKEEKKRKGKEKEK